MKGKRVETDMVTDSRRFPSYAAFGMWLAQGKYLNVRVYQDGQSIVVTYEHERIKS